MEVQQEKVSSPGYQQSPEMVTMPRKDIIQQWSEIVSGGNSHSSWADKVEQELSSTGKDQGKETQHKGKSIWNNFDISKPMQDLNWSMLIQKVIIIKKLRKLIWGT